MGKFKLIRFNRVFFLVIYSVLITWFLPNQNNAQSISVSKFLLLNVDGNRRIPEYDPLSDSTVLDFSSLPTRNLNILARVIPDSLVNSVIFNFDGNPLFNVETAKPFTLFGDDAGIYKGTVFSAGWHTLKCTPFTGTNGTGTAGTPLTIHFKVIDSSVDVPFIELGQNQIFNLPQNQTSLKALVVDNGLPEIPGKTTLHWELVSGKPGVTFSSTDSIVTNITFTESGTYLFKATTTDGLFTSNDSIYVVVRPQPSVPPSLKTIPIPEPEMINGFDFTQFVVNKDAAVKLGKALFWDMQVGSDGIQACASCHYHAGADVRFKNTMSPGLLGIGNKKFEKTRGPNYSLISTDFPFAKEDDDIVSSQGVFFTEFNDILQNSSEDAGNLLGDEVYSVTAVQTRRVQTRNSPSVINAVYSYRSNWNGNAQSIFNGVSPEGLHDKNAKLLEIQGDQIIPVSVAIPYSSLASQSTGPPLNDLEMSFKGRTFQKIGKKLLRLKPLSRQIVDPTDSQLGEMSNFPLKGLKSEITYESLIKTAFNSKWWNSDKVVTYSGSQVIISEHKDTLTSDEYTLIEANFSLFWGLALQAYQATLVSDDSKFDKFREGSASLTESETRGLNLFMGKARCINCHSGAEFSNASVTNQRTGKLIDRMPVRDSSVALYDVGFYNIGMRHMAEDPGAEARDRVGIFLTYSRQLSFDGKLTDTVTYDSNSFTIPGEVNTSEKIAVRGTFKVPTLRNVELNGPYFHNGGKATLKQAIEGYDVGNHFAGENWRQMPLDITELRLTEDEQNDLVAFLLTLTDERVRIQSEPFDHPQLFLPHGHEGNQFSIINDGSGRAVTEFVEIKAVGRAGGPPLLPFLEQQFEPGNPDDTLVVPVELISFSGEASGKRVTLHWETATESNNYGFEIERLQDYKITKLQDSWEKVGFIKGSGTTAEKNKYTFEDNIIYNVPRLHYRIKQIDLDGTFTYSNEITILLQPIQYSLLQNYPNPFNPVTTINFSVPNPGLAKLIVFNTIGEQIAVLINEEIDAGYHSVSFNALNLASGVYFYKLESGDFISIKKMLLIR